MLGRGDRGFWSPPETIILILLISTDKQWSPCLSSGRESTIKSTDNQTLDTIKELKGFLMKSRITVMLLSVSAKDIVKLPSTMGV